MADCENCGSWENERFRFLALEFDVAGANKLVVEGRETRVVPESFLRALGLPLDPVKCESCGVAVDDCACGKLSYRMPLGTGINEKHLEHLQEPERPGLIATVLHKKKVGDDQRSGYLPLLIDGNHRAVRAFREGREFKAVMLTPQESWSILSGPTKSLLNPNTKAGKARLAELGWDK